ncbi:MAG: hypothetical protein FWF15_10070 [Oscillospiraceae bacterium]|nr:hypothetical protein [Oscillospiraceae bacterium]
MQKFFCLITALLILISVIAACGDSNSGSNETTTAAANVDTTESVDSRPPLNVPAKDYGGYQFNILTVNTYVTGNNINHGANYYSDFIYVGERAGEPINDAVYDRNLKMMEEFGVEIVAAEAADVYGQARKLIQSGDNLYDVITPPIDSSFQLAQEKFLYNLYNIPYLELSNPWWDQALIKNLSLNNKLYVITGDISIQDEEYNWCFGYNKELLNQTSNALDLHQLVRDGKWTLDVMYDLGKSVTRDLNGDGVLDNEDLFAYGNDYSATHGFFSSAGEKIAMLDKDGYPQLTVGGERAITVIDRLTEIFNDTNFMIWASKMSKTVTDNGWLELRLMFREGRLMLYTLSMYVVKVLRDMVDDFSLLPAPKFDERQENYYMSTTTVSCLGICIPITNMELERTGIILEAMSYYSKPIKEAYYDITLIGKITRDEESRDMLEIIFNSVSYDIGDVFGWGGYKNQIYTATQKNTGFTALYEANRTRAENEIVKSYDIFLEIDT